MEANRSAITGPQGRRQPGRRWAGWQVGPPSGVEVINKSRASARASQSGSGQAGGQSDPLHGVIGSTKSRALVRASQPGSNQAGGQDSPLRTGGNQGNGVIAPASLWQAGV
ncbi:hypothetical protein CIW54_28380 (plasmid) [Paraburkholderia sp. T12-10]|nr:hypothetical protein CIW54_28380 [Paraburkholderia sp. T12-10]